MSMYKKKFLAVFIVKTAIIINYNNLDLSIKYVYHCKPLIFFITNFNLYYVQVYYLISSGRIRHKIDNWLTANSR